MGWMDGWTDGRTEGEGKEGWMDLIDKEEERRRAPLKGGFHPLSLSRFLSLNVMREGLLEVSRPFFRFY